MQSYKIVSRLSLLLVLLITFLSTGISPAFAQENVDGPVYIVQSGDSLYIIAVRFGVTVDEIISANNITDANAITAGTSLIIPGLEGVSGTLMTQTVQLGESLESLSITNQIPKNLLIKINRITSPLEAYVGANIIIPQLAEQKPLGFLFSLKENQTLIESSARPGLNQWDIVLSNQMTSTWDAVPETPFYHSSASSSDNTSGLIINPYITGISITPLPMYQGSTVVVSINTIQPLAISGSLAGQKLNFFPDGENKYLALQGINAMNEVGASELSIQANKDDIQVFNFKQLFIVNSGLFGQDPPLEVDPATIDPTYTGPEEDQLSAITMQASPTRYWSGPFQYPIDEPCIKSWYGNRRLYNDTLRSFHTGVDFGVCASNLNIYAPAPGVVVFTGQLNIRGNATIIDHGWGVYTGYWHQEQIMVQQGEQVQAGQLIGTVGATGRVTGPHLHWEIRVGNVQVNPLSWIETTYP